MRTLMRGTTVRLSAAFGGPRLWSAGRMRLLAGTTLVAFLAATQASAANDADLPCNQLCQLWLGRPGIRQQPVAAPEETIDTPIRPMLDVTPRQDAAPRPEAAPRHRVQRRPSRPRPPIIHAAAPQTRPLTALDIQLMRTSLAAPLGKPAEAKRADPVVATPSP